MNSALLAGLFAGWAAVQIAVGVFFIQVYTLRRREFEYLLFGLVCLAIALTDAGLALTGATAEASFWVPSQRMTHLGALISTALNFHFVVLFTSPNKLKRFVPAVYAVTIALCLVLLAGGWWVQGTLHLVHSEIFGLSLGDMRARPTTVGLLGYGVMMLVDTAVLGVLVTASRRGRREVLGATIGFAVVMICGAIDVHTVTEQLSRPLIFTYGFFIYGFGVADTLLVRYRRAAEELEVTADELRHTTEELTNSYLELSSVQEELFRKRQLASVGELAASIAHEVRNPLAIIVNAAANLKRVNLIAGDRDTLFGIIEEEITRLNNIVTELLQYARPVNVQREDVALRAMIASLAEGMGQAHTLTLSVASAPDVETVWADPTLVRLALQNVVDNARLAMPKGGGIVVTATVDTVGDASGVRLDVVDRGQGMDAQTLKRARDPFFSTRPSGTGLGLPITDRIVEAHGGRVDVQSRPGEGTTVSLFIPGKREARLSEHPLSRGSRA